MARIRKSDENILNLWKVAIYIRLSKEDGNDESYSVKNQRQRLNIYLENLKLEEDMELVDFYADDGFTGTDSNRFDFQRMLNDIDNDRVNCVIVKDLSRLSRNDWECKRYLQELFVVKNIRFISLELPQLDSFKRPGEVYDFGVSIQSMFNENHCRETSIKIRAVFDTKRTKGEFIGAFAPYGYSKDPADKHRFIIDEEAAGVVKDIFHLFVNVGISKNGIVRKLTELGILCPTAYKQQIGLKYSNPNIVNNSPLWSSRSVSTILSNQMYLGHMVQGKYKIKSYKIQKQITTERSEWYIVENTHEPIIDEKTFEKAQELLKRDTRAVEPKGKNYLFSGFLRCADCSKAMGRRKTGNFIYYTCKTYNTLKLCSRHSINHKKLENAVLITIQKQIALIDDISKLIDDINNAAAPRTVSKRVNELLKTKKKEFEKYAGLKAGLYTDWKSGDITQQEYRNMKKIFIEKEEKLQHEIEALTEEQKCMEQGVTSNDPYFEAFLKYKNIQTLDRGIITELIKTIHIHEGGELTITFDFADQHKRIVEFIENNRKELNAIENEAV